MLKTAITFLISLSIFQCQAQSPAQKIEQRFNHLLEDPQAKYAFSSICILDARTGKEIFSKNAQTGVATASTLKTITAITALAVLGKDFRYQTELAYTGTITAEGLLKGDILIKGSGDPTLGSFRYEHSKESYLLNQWARAIQAAGIRKIAGKIIGDDRLWGSGSTPDGWIWQDIGNYYGAAPSALSWRENEFELKLQPGRPVRLLRTVPEMPYLKIRNELKPGAAGTGDQAYVYLPPLGDIAYIRGSWAVDMQKTGIAAALPDPAYDAAFRLQDTLRKAGITLDEAATTSRRLAAAGQPLSQDTHTLTTSSSPALPEIIYWMEKKSINLYAENLLKTMAWKSGKEATTANGAEVEINYWAARGLDRNALGIIDGSGLSPATRVTPAAMANILFQAQKEPWFADFYQTLPDHNGMKLKSGTINKVSAFAGYYNAAGGNKYVIVITINNYSGGAINPKLFSVLDALKS